MLMGMHKFMGRKKGTADGYLQENLVKLQLVRKEQSRSSGRINRFSTHSEQGMGNPLFFFCSLIGHGSIHITQPGA